MYNSLNFEVIKLLSTYKNTVEHTGDPDIEIGNILVRFKRLIYQMHLNKYFLCSKIKIYDSNHKENTMIQKTIYDPKIRATSNVFTRLKNEYIVLVEFENYIGTIHTSIQKEFSLQFDKIMIQTLDLDYQMKRENIFVKYSLSFCKNINIKNPLLEDFIKITKFPMYYYFKLFIEIYGRERGIYHIKYFIDIIMREKFPSGFKPDNLNYLLAPDDEATYPTEAINYVFNKGKIASRIDKCLWHEVMTEMLDDNEISYLTCCYWDFMDFESMGKQFHFTRSKCKMQGDSYCDPCAHDLRFNDHIVHPNTEFFESLQIEKA